MDATGLLLDGQYLSMFRSKVHIYQMQYLMNPSEETRQKLEEARGRYAAVYSEAADLLTTGGCKGAPVMAEYLAQMGPIECVCNSLLTAMYVHL